MKNIPDTLKKLLQMQAKSIGKQINSKAVPAENSHQYSSNVSQMVANRKANEKNKTKKQGPSL